MVAGIVLFALGLKTTLGHVGDALGTVPAVGLCGGAALYLALIPAAIVIPAIAALALVSAVCSLVVAYEAIGRREHRIRVRHPELAG